MTCGIFVRVGIIGSCISGVPTTGLANTFAHQPEISLRQGVLPSKLERLDALIFSKSGFNFELSLQAILSSTGQPYFVWLIPLPSPPSVETPSTVNDAQEQSGHLFDELAGATVHRPTNAQKVREHPLGPSLFGFIPRQWLTKVAPRSVSEISQTRSLEIHGIKTFSSSPSETSTNSSDLPQDLLEFLKKYQVQAPATARLNTYLNKGWSVLAIALFDEAQSAGLVRAGPIRLRVRAKEAVLPLLLSAENHQPTTFVSVLADRPLIPNYLPTKLGFWRNQIEDNTLTVLYAAQLHKLVTLYTELTGVFGQSLKPDIYLTHSLLKPENVRLDHLTLVPALRTSELPSSPGTHSDLFICFILGLAPLILAPEVWLIWLFTAFDPARTQLGQRLGAVWSLIVAIYWLLTLDQLARIASLGPLLVGTILVALSAPSRVPVKQIRVQFEAPSEEAEASENQKPPKAE